MKRIVLAYSGGLDTSVAIPWLRERYHAEIIAVTMDLGQGRELEEVRDRALAAGAIRAHVLDLREEFARDFIIPALKADAIYEDRYPMATALGRALIAQKLVEIAEIEQAAAVAHGCTGQDNDQARFDVTTRALNPRLKVLAPARDWGMTRPETIEYALRRDVRAPVAVSSPFSIDGNLWGRSIECGTLEDPWTEPPEEIYTITKSPGESPNEAAYVEVRFEEGVPTAINGVAMPILDLISSLSTIAGTHGVGRIDMVENRLVGIKSREIYEAPAAVVLHIAHKELQKLVTSRDLERFSRAVSLQYADIIYNGLWFTPLREALDGFIAKVQERVTGSVRLKLFKGDCRIVGRKSPFALYDEALATHAAGDTFDHAAAAGFVKIWGLPAEIAARKAPAAPKKLSAIAVTKG
ncbi:MAG: argininosuccinate synthase [Acidobacteria bacterium]|nr:argininosuccinate synthase [Acidobacteriota bacterium]